MSPVVFFMSPVSILNVVVLPAPFEPNKPKHSLAFSARFRPFTASLLPYFFQTLLKEYKGEGRGGEGKHR